jgi:hypothetical protein
MTRSAMALWAVMTALVASDGDTASSGGSTGGEQSAGDSSGTAQVGSAGVSAPIRVASDGDSGGGPGDTGTGALGEPVDLLDGAAPDSRTGAQVGPVAVTESLPGGGGTDLLGTSSTTAGLRFASNFVGAGAGDLPLTGLGVMTLLLLGLALLSGGSAIRRGSVAAG